MNTEMTISGIKYTVVGVKNFEFNGKSRQSITLVRPNGKRMYNVVRYENGSLSGVTPIGMMA